MCVASRSGEAPDVIVGCEETARLYLLFAEVLAAERLFQALPDLFARYRFEIGRLQNHIDDGSVTLALLGRHYSR
jgi:hypothetical protein